LSERHIKIADIIMERATNINRTKFLEHW
jgi:hypothetical protein